MSIQNWITNSCATSDIVVKRMQHAESKRMALDMQGYEGTTFLVPRRDHNVRGRLSGCFRTLFTKTQDFPEQSEIRIYCMMSDESLRVPGSYCYAAGLSGNKRITLYKYTNSIAESPEILCSLRLPAEYKRGVFGLIWVYNPQIREGVFLRGLLSVDPQNPQNAFRLFDYVDTDNPLTQSDGEGFGLSIPLREYTHALFERTSLHAVQHHDPLEEEE